MANKIEARSLSIRRGLTRVVTGGLGTAALVAPGAAQARPIPQSAANSQAHTAASCEVPAIDPNAVTSPAAAAIKSRIAHGKSVPIAPDQGVFWTDINGCKWESTVPIPVTEPDGQKDYFRLVQTRTSKHASRSQALRGVDVVQIQPPFETTSDLGTEEFFTSVSNPNVTDLTSSATSAVIRVGFFATLHHHRTFVRTAGNDPSVILRLSDRQTHETQLISAGATDPGTPPTPITITQ